MSRTSNDQPATTTKGRVLHSALRYDAFIWLFMLGRERRFREKLVELARLEPGESVLDIGCGTGTLAIAAKRRVGATGRVAGIDASPEMIDRATRKARRAGADVEFRSGVVEELPYANGTFDAVLSTVMLHHLPRNAREACAREIARVLRPAGRVLIVDFGPTPGGKRSILGHFHRHGHVALDDIVQLLQGAGLEVIETGPVGTRQLYYAVARSRKGP